MEERAHEALEQSARRKDGVTVENTVCLDERARRCLQGWARTEGGVSLAYSDYWKFCEKTALWLQKQPVLKSESKSPTQLPSPRAPLFPEGKGCDYSSRQPVQ